MANESNWVLLRGLMRESRHWDQFPDLLKSQIPGAHVHMVDLPGNGMNFDKKTPLTIRGIMEEVRSQYLRRLHDRKIPTFVVSISLGGMVAAEWLSRHPEELSGAVLLNTSFSSLSPVHKRLKLGSVAQGAKILATKNLFQKEMEILSMTTNLIRGKAQYAEKFAAYAEEYPISVKNGLRQVLAASYYRLPRKRPAVPILVLTGERDRMVDPSCSHNLVKAWDTDFSFHPTAGHDLTLDAPEWVSERIRAWTEKLHPDLI